MRLVKAATASSHAKFYSLSTDLELAIKYIEYIVILSIFSTRVLIKYIVIIVLA